MSLSALPRLNLTTLSGRITAACLLEATARKPGNVHPGASFSDLTYMDFVASALAVEPVLANSSELGVGKAILAAVQATRQVTSSNTNLGMILLLAPLAAALQGHEQPITREVVQQVLNRLTVEDSRLVYRAIRLAQPGGMGSTGEQDVASEPTLPLVEIMRLAADRDRIARQYVSGFQEIFDVGLASLEKWISLGHGWETVVLGNQLDWLASGPDTLIARKLGMDLAQQASTKAAEVLAASWPETTSSQQRLAELDVWLRGDGHRRNPGSTADLVAATLFVAIQNRLWRPSGMDLVPIE